MQSSLTLDTKVADDGGIQKRRSLKWAIIIGFWIFFGVLNGTQIVVGVWMEGMHIPFWRLFATDFLGWLIWIPATPIVLALGRRFPVERGT